MTTRRQQWIRWIAGVGLVLENMLPHLFAGHVRDLLWLLGALASTNVGICLDTGHAFLSGDLHHVAHKLSGHLWMVHASDNRGERDDHLPPGEGQIAWPDLLHQLSTSHFTGAFILELAAPDDAAELLRRAQSSADYLRRLAGVPT
jgi:sugar phosphate isomerase/epimerase